MKLTDILAKARAAKGLPVFSEQAEQLTDALLPETVERLINLVRSQHGALMTCGNDAYAERFNGVLVAIAINDFNAFNEVEE